MIELEIAKFKYNTYYGTELNLRFIFEVKILDCDVSLNYMIYKPNKTTVYIAEKTQEVKTLYKSHYENNELVTTGDNI